MLPWPPVSSVKKKKKGSKSWLQRKTATHIPDVSSFKSWFDTQSQHKNIPIKHGANFLNDLDHKNKM